MSNTEPDISIVKPCPHRSSVEKISHPSNPTWVSINDQRSTLDQLITLIILANKEGLYDAADFLKDCVKTRLNLSIP